MRGKAREPARRPVVFAVSSGIRRPKAPTSRNPDISLPCALMSGLKRSLEESSHDGDRPSPSGSPASATTVKPASPAAPASSSSFRNVSACNRCRLRKNRCDQRLPSCASCDKAGVKCVGYDPITKREIPRRYERSRERELSRAPASAHC